MPVSEEFAGVTADDPGESGGAQAAGKAQGCRGAGVHVGGAWAEGGADLEAGCVLGALHTAEAAVAWLGSAVLLCWLDLDTMEGPQEPLTGKLRLCFSSAPRTSFLLLRLNDPALRALRECQRQQVRLTSLLFPPLYLERNWGASACDLGEGTGRVRRRLLQTRVF